MDSIEIIKKIQELEQNRDDFETAYENACAIADELNKKLTQYETKLTKKNNAFNFKRCLVNHLSKKNYELKNKIGDLEGRINTYNKNVKKPLKNIFPTLVVAFLAFFLGMGVAYYSKWNNFPVQTETQSVTYKQTPITSQPAPRSEQSSRYDAKMDHWVASARVYLEEGYRRGLTEIQNEFIKWSKRIAYGNPNVKLEFRKPADWEKYSCQLSGANLDDFILLEQKSMNRESAESDNLYLEYLQRYLCCPLREQLEQPLPASDSIYETVRDGGADTSTKPTSPTGSKSSKPLGWAGTLEITQNYETARDGGADTSTKSTFPTGSKSSKQLRRSGDQ